jgi:hypothetical protein
MIHLYTTEEYDSLTREQRKEIWAQSTISQRKEFTDRTMSEYFSFKFYIRLISWIITIIIFAFFGYIFYAKYVLHHLMFARPLFFFALQIHQKLFGTTIFVRGCVHKQFWVIIMSMPRKFSDRVKIILALSTVSHLNNRLHEDAWHTSIVGTRLSIN